MNGKSTFSWLGLSELTIHALGYLGNKSTLPVLLNVVRNSDNLDTVKMAEESIEKITLRLAKKNNDLLYPSEMDSGALLMPSSYPDRNDLLLPVQHGSNSDVSAMSIKLEEQK